MTKENIVEKTERNIMGKTEGNIVGQVVPLLVTAF